MGQIGPKSFNLLLSLFGWLSIVMALIFMQPTTLKSLCPQMALHGLLEVAQELACPSANGVASFDANNKIIFAYASCAFSTDGGVTWKGAQINSFTQNSGPLGQHPFVTPSLGALGKVLLGGRGSGYVSPGKIRAVELSSLTAGGSQAKNGNTITSLRSSALAFVRVE